jgi:hypothetical protein
VSVVAHALYHLNPGPYSSDAPKFTRVCVNYRPKDIWATMHNANALADMLEEGIWFTNQDMADRGGEGETWRALWAELRDYGVEVGSQGQTSGFEVDMRIIKWEGDVEQRHVGDALEVVFTRAETHGAERESVEGGKEQAENGQDGDEPGYA